MKNKTAVLGGGCFWCLEAVFQNLRGVQNVTSGYAGGLTENPTYEEVCSGSSGHAEVAKIEFDPAIISYENLLNVFFSLHDPTTPNRQGPDTGPQYRSIIFYNNDSQKATAQEIIAHLEKEKIFPNPIVTEVRPLTNFYPAEDYHKNYYLRNSQAPYCQAVISPKLAKMRQKYLSLMK